MAAAAATDALRRAPSATDSPPAVQDLLVQLRAMGLGRTLKDRDSRTYAGLAAAGRSANGRQRAQQSAYFRQQHEATRGTPPPAKAAGTRATTPGSSGRPALAGSLADEEELLLFGHMSGLKGTPGLHRSQSMPQQQAPSPAGVQRSFSFTPDPAPREQEAAPVPTQRTPPGSRPGSRGEPASATPATSATQAPFSTAAAVPPHAGSGRSSHRQGGRASRSGTRPDAVGGPTHAASAVPGITAVAGAQPPAWSEEMLNWMLAEKAELLMQLQRAQRERSDLAAEVERLRSRAASDQELGRLQAERRALLDRVQQLSRAEAEASAAMERLRMENDALAGELEHSQEVCREMLAARRAARDALSEMSAQNARLVTAYVERKQEAMKLADALRRQERDADRRIKSLETQLADARAQLARQQPQEPTGQGQPPALPETGSPGVSVRPSPAHPPTAPPCVASGSPGSKCGSPTQLGGSPQMQHQEEGKENATLNSTSRKERASKVLWDHERSELLSLLERLQEQLSVHAGQPEEVEDEEGAELRAEDSPVPQASPSEGEEGSPPAAAYDSVEEELQHGAGDSPSSAAANLDASFEQAASGSGLDSSTWSDEDAGSSPAVVEHQMEAMAAAAATPPALNGSPPAGATPASAAGSAPFDREAAPSPPSGRPAGATTAQMPPAARPRSGGGSLRLSPFSMPKAPVAGVSEQPVAKPKTTASPASPLCEQDKQRQLEEVEQRNAQLQAEVERLRQAAERTAECSERRQRAEAHKQAGNAAFQQRQYEAAAAEYTSGLELLQDLLAHDAAQKQQQDCNLAAVLHCNRAAALQAGGRCLEAIADCYRAQGRDPGYLRVYQRRADAYCALGAYGLAVQDLERAVEMGGGAEATARLAEVARLARGQPPVNHYAVLGLGPAATPAEVKSAYRRLALRFHPDKAGGASSSGAAGDGGAADAIFKLVTEAHSVLADPERRRAHDILALRYKYKRVAAFA